ncbi:pyrroline-5-carboxylate reductase [Paracoccus sp. S-4012]|uniref:pyrroline-5-carboxylate reductase n=1 Tax=Paracoccus sp. S-4012 TaxID=2665648 RepID=UPI0012B07F3C|nr:pyrroline-5-carboxylate reductase [Paracoccus sp. S-4012]MRX49767.1 pyrroline-5-carboxylate reductase [Paracoccus sp. S-4012]
MDLSHLNDRGLLLVGCGKMGGALLDGWLARGLRPGAVHVVDPALDPALGDRGVAVNGPAPADPAVLVLAVKPQVMDSVLPDLAAYGHGGTLIVSVAAGTTLARLGRAFPDAPIVRAMPNTPAAIGQGITAITGNGKADAEALDLAQTLMEAVGHVVRLQGEHQIDAVTGLSGSGPAYVFHMIEAMTDAGEAAGLPRDLALELARTTVAGAGALAMASDAAPSKLREDVTSPNGTTAAGLAVLMDEARGLRPLMRATVAAAAARGRELAG